MGQGHLPQAAPERLGLSVILAVRPVARTIRTPKTYPERVPGEANRPGTARRSGQNEPKQLLIKHFNTSFHVEQHR